MQSKVVRETPVRTGGAGGRAIDGREEPNGAICALRSTLRGKASRGAVLTDRYSLSCRDFPRLTSLASRRLEGGCGPTQFAKGALHGIFGAKRARQAYIALGKALDRAYPSRRTRIACGRLKQRSNSPSFTNGAKELPRRPLKLPRHARKAVKHGLVRGNLAWEEQCKRGGGYNAPMVKRK